ncbi:MAG: hypothetical protein ACFFDJ_05865 [Candidatus Odinarchaeota archaeon]
MMSKKDIGRAVGEILRVLRPRGLCFWNFVSIDESPPQGTIEIGKREFLVEGRCWYGGPLIDSFFEDNEPDQYFRRCAILHKEKRTIEREIEGTKEFQAYLDYIAKKK